MVTRMATDASSPVRNWRGLGPALPALVLLALFFVIPVVSLLLRSVLEPQPGLQNYAELFATSTYARVFYNTFLVASVVTAVSLALGYPVAWLLAIMPQGRANIVMAIIKISMWTNVLARTFAWMVLLQPASARWIRPRCRRRRADRSSDRSHGAC